MKKIIFFLTFLLMMITVSSCVNKKANNSNNNQDQNSSSTHVLVAYFSITSSTKGIAKMIEEKTNGDMYEIEALNPYTEADLKYYTGCRADKEQADEKCRPEIGSKKIENINDYDYIFLGYPIWHSQAPKIIYTFLESYDLSNKVIIPFCTSSSSGIGSSATNLHQSSLNSVWKDGKRFAKNTSKEVVEEWIMSMDLNIRKNNVGSFNLQNAKNQVAPTVKLNSGYEMPILGLGTYSLLGNTCVESVKSALNLGYRLIDTAYMYQNEKEVGQAIRESGVPRSEIFVITKLYPNQFSNPKQAIQDALDKLDIEYIDMMLLHHPGTNDVEAYLEIEEFVKSGKIRSIGLSNWYIEEIDEFISKVNIKPALIQNEIHPYYQETEVVKYMHDLGIVMQAWYPLGGRGYTKELLNNEVIVKIAENHNVSSAQVILRWDMQNGVVAIPGSSNPIHQLENISIFEFELSDEEMQQMASLERFEKHDWY